MLCSCTLCVCSCDREEASLSTTKDAHSNSAVCCHCSCSLYCFTHRVCNGDVCIASLQIFTLLGLTGIFGNQVNRDLNTAAYDTMAHTHTHTHTHTHNTYNSRTQLLYVLGVYWAGPVIASALQPIIPVWTAVLAVLTCTEKIPSLFLVSLVVILYSCTPH